MSGVNKVIILGRLGQDPEVKSLASGQQVCTVSLATSESWVKDGNKEERTEWHRVVFWGKQAELAGKYLKKGRNVYVEGKLQTRSWEQDGQKKYSTEIVATQMTFVDSGERGASSGGRENYGNEQRSNDGYNGGGGGGYDNSPSYDAPRQSSGGGMKVPDLDDDVPF